MTQAEALAWLNGGWHSSPYCKTYNGLTGIDTDGMWGFQCKDFVNAYLKATIGWMPSGNAIDLWTMPLPANVQRIANTPSFVPQPGDVFVYGKPYGFDPSNGEYYGHTGVILTATVTSFTSIDQNWNKPSLTIGSPPAVINHNYNGFLGVLRPTWSQGEDMPIPDADNYYWRYGQKLAMQVRGRQLSRDEFRKNIVGRTDLQAVETLSDDPEADTAQKWQDTGKTAITDNWEAQIVNGQQKVKDLQASNDQLTKAAAIKDGEISKLQAELAATGNDSVQLNALGTALKWLIQRLGLGK